MQHIVSIRAYLRDPQGAIVELNEVLAKLDEHDEDVVIRAINASRRGIMGFALETKNYKEAMRQLDLYFDSSRRCAVVPSQKLECMSQMALCLDAVGKKSEAKRLIAEAVEYGHHDVSQAIVEKGLLLRTALKLQQFAGALTVADYTLVEMTAGVASGEQLLDTYQRKSEALIGLNRAGDAFDYLQEESGGGWLPIEGKVKLWDLMSEVNYAHRLHREKALVMTFKKLFSSVDVMSVENLRELLRTSRRSAVAAIDHNEHNTATALLDQVYDLRRLWCGTGDRETAIEIEKISMQLTRIGRLDLANRMRATK